MIDETDERHAGTGVAMTTTQGTQTSEEDERSDGAAGWPAAFLGDLADSLDRAGVRWVILRNHQDLPDRIGHDVDIIVHPDDAETTELVVRGVASPGRDVPGALLPWDRAPQLRRGRPRPHGAALPPRGHPDLHAVPGPPAGRRRGTPRGPAPLRACVGPLTRRGGLRILLHAGLNKHALKPKYRGRVVALGARASRGDRAGGDPRPRPRSRPASRRGAHRGRAPRARPASSSGRSTAGTARTRCAGPAFEVRSTLTQARLKLRPRGLFVCFLGPDGSGKSSTTDLMAQLLGAQQAVLPVRRVYMGSGTPVLPTRKLTRRLHGIKKDGEGRARRSAT